MFFHHGKFQTNLIRDLYKQFNKKYFVKIVVRLFFSTGWLKVVVSVSFRRLLNMHTRHGYIAILAAGFHGNLDHALKVRKMRWIVFDTFVIPLSFFLYCEKKDTNPSIKLCFGRINFLNTGIFFFRSVNKNI